MKKIEAQTLEEALILATKELGCSVVDLEYAVVQNPSKGFLGIGKKLAVICVQLKQGKGDSVHQISNETSEESNLSQKQEPQDYRDSSENIQVGAKSPREKKTFSREELEKISQQVKKELEELLSYLPYKLNEVLVEPYDENTLFVKIDGEDSALLIGKEGYRYKAISYLIFNWINHVYGLMIRLEIAEFLQNQEEMIANYLVGIIENVEATGKAQTKPLDGVLAHIALKQLRERFPDKYVSFRLNAEGERYIVVNDFYRC